MADPVLLGGQVGDLGLGGLPVLGQGALALPALEALDRVYRERGQRPDDAHQQQGFLVRGRRHHGAASEADDDAQHHGGGVARAWFLGRQIHLALRDRRDRAKTRSNSRYPSGVCVTPSRGGCAGVQRSLFSPIRTTSPLVSIVGSVTGVPSTNVPFREQASEITAWPSAETSSTALT